MQVGSVDEEKFNFLTYNAVIGSRLILLVRFLSN